MMAARWTRARTTWAGWALVAMLGAAAVFALVGPTPSPASAQDDSEDIAAVAKEELAKAIARGKELFGSRELGRKSCQECHENADKPEDDLRDRAFAYPAYSRRARRVVTLQQKINEMIKFKARGQELDQDGADIAALAAYVESIRKK